MSPYKQFVCVSIAVAAAWQVPAQAAPPAPSAEMDALELKSEPEPAATQANADGRHSVEVAAGTMARRYGLGSASVRRVSLDLFQAFRLGTNVRAVISNRTDHLRPDSSATPGAPDTLNSLREAYISWDLPQQQSVVEFGRINLRQGQGYGYNPTDFFRDHALRSVVSVNPSALRENRLGTVMLRLQRSWEDGSLSLSLAPKLSDSTSNSGTSLALGATNYRNRVMATLNHRFSDRVSAQLSLYKEPKRSAQFGASASALISDSLVAFGEWSLANAPTLASSAGLTNEQRRGSRFVAGFTYTTPGKLSLTSEVQASQFALGDNEWTRVVADPRALGAYLLLAEQMQDLASRRAYLVHVSQKDFLLRGLDLSGFVRINAFDHSRLSWLELRHHWSSIDVALQWQQAAGKSFSQYGFSPEKTVTQLLVSYHFR